MSEIMTIPRPSVETSMAASAEAKPARIDVEQKVNPEQAEALPPVEGLEVDSLSKEDVDKRIEEIEKELEEILDEADQDDRSLVDDEENEAPQDVPENSNEEESEEEQELEIDKVAYLKRIIYIIVKGIIKSVVGPSVIHKGSEFLPVASPDGKQESWIVLYKEIEKEEGTALQLMNLALALNDRFPPMKLAKKDTSSGAEQYKNSVVNKKPLFSKMAAPKRLAVASAK